MASLAPAAERRLLGEVCEPGLGRDPLDQEESRAPRVEQGADGLPPGNGDLNGVAGEGAVGMSYRRERDLDALGPRGADPHLALAERFVGADRSSRALDAVGIVPGAAVEIAVESGDGLRAGLGGARGLADHVAVLRC